MLDTIYLLVIIILIILNIMSIAIGYIIGKINTSNSRETFGAPSILKHKQSTNSENNPNKITIDDRKFVTDISTEGIEKKYNELGNTKITDDNISASVNKLQNLKR